MSPIIVSTFGAFTALLLVFAISEILAKVTKGWVPSVLVIMILMLVGFSTGLFPKTIIDDAGVSDALFKVACGLLVTHLGTLISRKEMAAQWKTVIISLGRAMSVQRYSCAGFGDSTDFGIYTFPGASPGESEYFKPVTAESKTELLGYIDEFEQVIDSLRDGDEGADLVNNYRFSRDDIDESDYLYISDRDGEAIGEGVYSKYDSYNVYFFDSQTTTLYYFHNNI
mgnify:FL=1